ncbi:hypothetical protein J6590_021246 [Homalodisca vitripennis]|nr:hypothetical protein J6590_021246 [Homalodisca vitripennis]
MITEALSFLHYSGHVLHRNVCPSSILVTKKGTWKLGGLEFTEEHESAANFKEWDVGRCDQELRCFKGLLKQLTIAASVIGRAVEPIVPTLFNIPSSLKQVDWSDSVTLIASEVIFWYTWGMSGILEESGVSEGSKAGAAGYTILDTARRDCQ